VSEERQYRSARRTTILATASLSHHGDAPTGKNPDGNTNNLETQFREVSKMLEESGEEQSE